MFRSQRESQSQDRFDNGTHTSNSMTQENLIFRALSLSIDSHETHAGIECRGVGIDRVRAWIETEILRAAMHDHRCAQRHQIWYDGRGDDRHKRRCGRCPPGCSSHRYTQLQLIGAIVEGPRRKKEFTQRGHNRCRQPKSSRRADRCAPGEGPSDGGRERRIATQLQVGADGHILASSECQRGCQ